MHPILLPCLSERAKEKRVDDRNCLKSLTHHAAGIGNCIQSDMTYPSHPSSEMHPGKFTDHTELQRWSWNVNFRTEICSNAKNPTRALQWIKEIEAAKSLDDLISPFNDGVGIEKVLRQANTLPKEDQCRGAESSGGQPVSQRETNCLFDLRIFSTYWIP